MEILKGIGTVIDVLSLTIILIVAYRVVNLLWIRPGQPTASTGYDIRGMVYWAEYFMGIGLGVFLSAGIVFGLCKMAISHVAKMVGE